MEQSWGLGRGDSAPDTPLRLFPSPKAARLAMEICLALDHIHSRGSGLLHRDIKPGNIVFDGSGNALLADFGSAAIVDEVRESVGGSIAGTPGYSAPEIHALDPASAKSDIWSLGATLLDLLTGCGELAKAQSVKKELMHAAQGGKPWTLEGNGLPRLAPEQREAWGRADPALRELVSSCLVVDPDKRPTAAELLQTPCLLTAQREKEFELNVVRPLRDEIKGLKDENEGLNDENKRLKDLNGKQQQENKGLKEQVKEIEGLRAKLEAATRELSARPPPPPVPVLAPSPASSCVYPSGPKANLAVPNVVGERLYEAARDGKVDEVRTLSSEWAGNHAALNWREECGWTPLFVACCCDRHEVVSVLIGTAGVEINMADDEGQSPLWTAAYWGKTQSVRVLLSAKDRGLDLNQKDDTGKTPLKIAREKNKAEVVALLEEAGASDV